MIPYRSHVIVGLVCLLIGGAGGLAMGWKLYHTEQVIETPKAEQRLEDLNVVVLQRLPENIAPSISPEIKKAAKKVGGKLERAATVTVQPKVSESSPDNCKCDPVTVDIGLVDQGDGKRIVTHTDNGIIIGGTDVPLEPYTVSKETKWEVGLVMPVENYEGTGGYVSRKLGPFSVGVQVAKPYADESYTAMATVGIRF